MSQVSRDYAPEGRELVAVVALDGGTGGDALAAAVQSQCADWYPEATDWELIRTYPIPDALPAQPPGVLTPPSRTGRGPDGIIRAGDYLETASIQGALASGILAARVALEP